MNVTLLIATASWLVLAASWLRVMPNEAPAKSWHYVHALWPVAAALFWFVAPVAWREPLGLWLAAGLVTFVFQCLAWAMGESLRNHGVMDVAYPILPVVIVGLTLVWSGVPGNSRELLIVVLVLIWAARLVAHMLGRNLGREMEPYASLRRRYGPRWTGWSFFSVYMLQGVIVWTWSAPLVFALSDPLPLGWLDAAAAAVWVLGFCFQAIGDSQLARFKRDPANRGKLMQSGLWRLTRHPNYFGEALVWCSYFLFALTNPEGWLTVIAPAHAIWFLAFGSAVPGNERHMRKTRTDYEDYARRVPGFVPWKWPSRATRG